MERVSDRRPEDTTASPAPFYVWAPEGKRFSVRLDFDVVDRLNSEVMRGLGAVPRRGAEVGGLLLGSMETEGERAIVHVRDFEPIACEHKRGPSYLLSENDERTFAEAVARWRSDDGRLQVVGYCRSHTRDGLSLALEDLELMERYFPQDHQVALLIRPFATKVARAGFFFRESGRIDPAASPLEFSFRRKEMGGAPPTSSTRSLGVEDPQASPLVALSSGASSALPPASLEAPATTPEQVRRSWVWIPLSFVFLMLGVLIGFQVAVNGFRPAPVAAPKLDFALGIQAIRSGDETNVTWDRSSLPVRNATHGLLHIRDGNFYRAVDLRAADLKNGSVLVRKVSNQVEFRLEVFQNQNLWISETRGAISQ